jgi:Na+/melibiose symporter-like transporter
MDAGIIRPTGLGTESSTDNIAFQTLSSDADHQQQTTIVVVVFCISLVVAVALTIGGFILRRRYHRNRARKEDHVKMAVRSVARQQWDA